MIARLEPIAQVLRVWDDGKKYGEPYEWVGTVRHIKADTIEILGYTKRVTPSIWRAIIKECQKEEIKWIIAVTYVDGIRKEKRIEVATQMQRLYNREMREESYEQ